MRVRRAGAPARGSTSLVLLIWGLALLAAIVQIARTDFSADLSAFLPRDPDPQQRLLIEQLESGAPSRTLMAAIDGGSAAERAAASKALAAALRTERAFEQVANGERAAFAGVGQWLFEHRYVLSPAVTPDRFTGAGLRDAIDETLSLLGTPGGAAVAGILERDPSGEVQRVAETLLPRSAPRSDGGVWVSRDGQRALLVLTLRAAGADLDAQQAAIARVRTAFDAARAGAPLALQLSGTPVFSVDSRDRIEREVKWLSIAGTAVMGALLLAAFASPAALGIALLPVASGVLAGIAATGLGFGTVHGITLGFGATLIGEAVDYAIYYLIQARPRADPSLAPGGGFRRWLADGWPTVRLGLATSVAGFAALVFSGFPGLAQLGVFSIAGLLAAAAVTRFVLPALRPDGLGAAAFDDRPMPGAQKAARAFRGGLSALAAAAARVLPLWRWPVAALAAVALVFTVVRGVPWSTDLASLSPVPRAAIELDQRLRAELGTADARLVVAVQAESLEATLQAAEAATARLDALVDAGRIGGVDSIVRWLPSQATQRARLASLPEREALVAALDEATRGGPLPASRLAPFVNDVQAARAGALLEAEALRESPVAALAGALLLRRPDGSAVALMPLQPPARGGELSAPAIAKALDGVPGAQVLDVKAELDGLYARYLKQALLLALAGAGAVVLLMALALRSVPRLVSVCVPLALAVVLLLGALTALNVQLSILHVVGLLLVVAVGSNYALFFESLHRMPDAAAAAGGRADDTLASLLLANITTVAGFGLLAFAEIPALSAIGRVVAPGALLALLLAAAFAPRSRAPLPPPAAGRRAGAPEAPPDDAADTTPDTEAPPGGRRSGA